LLPELDGSSERRTIHQYYPLLLYYLTASLAPVKPKTRVLEHGAYVPKDGPNKGKGIAWSVFLKEENRGKRDSQWLFIEIMRNMVFKLFH
jgi:hypothetical protein